MGFSTCELIAEAESQEGHTYEVTIETGLQGLGRLNVTCLKPESDEQENSQGVDLTSAECRALAKMLLATALLIDEDLDSEGL